MQRVVLTGIFGQDASYMADYLLDRFEDITVYGVARHCSSVNNIEHLKGRDRFHLVMGNLLDDESIESIVSRISPDYFINFAAKSFISFDGRGSEVIDTNVSGVVRCLEAIRKHAPNCRFFNAGSSEEFGEVKFAPQNESHELEAKNIYGVSKIAARQVVKFYRNTYNIYAVQAWMYNHESERRGTEFVTRKITKGVARINDEIVKGRPLTPIQLGDIEVSRDWSYATDFCDGIWRMLNQEVYNNKYLGVKDYILSSGETHSVREFIELSFKFAGIDILRYEGCYNNVNVSYVTDNKSYAVVITDLNLFRGNDTLSLRGDSNLIRTELGWRPNISFRQLVYRMVDNDIKQHK